ncbi:MAG TPA: DUF1501 domain-containing protein [Usitatibacter sp.]|nr:DUF1501 domain-containing protein [Usitatibacter sp.]
MNAPSPSRRRLLQALAAAPVAASLPSLAVEGEPNRLLVLVFLWGGNDCYNTWVPYANDLYRQVRPTIAIPRDAVLKVTDSHGFHPSLAPLMPMWEGKELALVQGIGYAAGTQQHFRDGDTAFTGCDGSEYSVDGWVTRAIRKRARTGGEDAIAFDVLDVRAADPMGPFRGGSLGCVQVYYAQDLLGTRHIDKCVFEANDRGRAHLAAYPGALPAVPLKTNFPTDPFGTAMRAAVELASIDRKLPVIHVALNGLDEDKHHSVDCHWNQLKFHGDALSRLANGLAALREGLKEIGRWDETLVATYDEFGRCPTENEDHGTHHGLASVHFVMGGRVKGGLIGEAPEVRNMFPHIGGPMPTIDTRRLWTTVAKQWWNADTSGLFSKQHQALDLLRA